MSIAPRLPDVECLVCPDKGIRMKHVGTCTRWPPLETGAGEQCEHVAAFRCRVDTGATS